MSYYTDEEKIVPTVVLGVILAIPIWVVAMSCASDARSRAAAELATETGIVHWWHSDNPDKAERPYYIWALLLTAGAFGLSYAVAPVLLGAMDAHKDARRREAAEQEQEKLHQSMQQLDAENKVVENQYSLAQSKQEIIMRLGTIDQFIRVFQGETERNRQIVTLQAAHAEVTNLSAKLASGEINREALKDAHVMVCGKETLADLDESGLGNDRLCRDLRRIFNMVFSQTGGAERDANESDPTEIPIHRKTNLKRTGKVLRPGTTRRALLKAVGWTAGAMVAEAAIGKGAVYLLESWAHDNAVKAAGLDNIIVAPPKPPSEQPIFDDGEANDKVRPSSKRPGQLEYVDPARNALADKAEWQAREARDTDTGTSIAEGVTGAVGGIALIIQLVKGASRGIKNIRV